MMSGSQEIGVKVIKNSSYEQKKEIKKKLEEIKQQNDQIIKR
jgi:hypothetical protein